MQMSENLALSYRFPAFIVMMIANMFIALKFYHSVLIPFHCRLSMCVVIWRYSFPHQSPPAQVSWSLLSQRCSALSVNVVWLNLLLPFSRFPFPIPRTLWFALLTWRKSSLLRQRDIHIQITLIHLCDQLRENGSFKTFSLLCAPCCIYMYSIIQWNPAWLTPLDGGLLWSHTVKEK